MFFDYLVLFNDLNLLSKPMLKGNVCFIHYI
nr:MAG TPA: hypothetical protein [Caudoviricetes sp.]